MLTITSYVDFNDTPHVLTFEVGPEELAVEAECDAIEVKLELDRMADEIEDAFFEHGYSF